MGEFALVCQERRFETTAPQSQMMPSTVVTRTGPAMGAASAPSIVGTRLLAAGSGVSGTIASPSGAGSGTGGPWSLTDDGDDGDAGKDAGITRTIVQLNSPVGLATIGGVRHFTITNSHSK